MFLSRRSCIRPEVSRTMTFGRKGVSNGQYFNQHLQYIVLEDNPYNFTSADLSYLLQVIHCVLYLFICLLS